MTELFDSGLSVFLMIAAVVGLVIAMQRQPGYRLMGIGMSVVAITSLLMSPSGPTTGGQLIAQTVGSLGGLACMFVGLQRIGPRRPPRAPRG